MFIAVTGKSVEIPLAEITGLREAKAFKTSVRGGLTHLIAVVSSGEIGFYVADNGAWTNDITNARRQGNQLTPPQH